MPEPEPEPVQEPEHEHELVPECCECADGLEEGRLLVPWLIQKHVNF